MIEQLKTDKEKAGVWVRSNKTFYLLVTGKLRVTNPQDRILNYLIQKEIIELDPYNKISLGKEPYVLMQLEEATDKGYQIEKIYLNPHIKAQLEKEETAPVNNWD